MNAQFIPFDRETVKVGDYVARLDFDKRFIDFGIEPKIYATIYKVIGRNEDLKKLLIYYRAGNTRILGYGVGCDWRVDDKWYIDKRPLRKRKLGITS